MTLFQYGQLIVVVAMLTVGQLLFRKAAVAAPPLTTLKGFFALGTSPLFFLALVIYGLTTLLWATVLQQIPLSRAYAFTALSFVFVPAAAVLVYGEKMTLQLAIGFCMVIAGLFLIGARS
jgi:drug/metabolite transporter (DMT)-like permease